MPPKSLEYLTVELWKRVDVRGPDECWLWKLRPTLRGYGQFDCLGGPKVHAHRMAWIVTHGYPPPGIQVLHRCDVRLCCNPSHMFLGTNGENHADKARKRKNLKYTDEQISAALALKYQGATWREAAASIGCSRDYLKDISLGRERRYRKEPNPLKKSWWQKKGV